MTQAVPTNGFIAPPAGGAAPPQNAEPGFVPQVPPAGAPAPAPAAAAPAAGTAPDLNAAIAALSAALASSAPAPAAGTPAPAAGTSFNDGGDPILKSMAAVVKTAAAGIDLDRLLGKAVEYGDVNLIDVAYLNEKGGASASELLTIAQGMVQAVNAKAAAVEREVHGLAGSEANWNAAAAAFNQRAAPELRTVVAQMLDSKNDLQIKAAARLIVDFAKSTGSVPTAGVLLQSGGAAPLSGQALSKEEFQIELRKLKPEARDYATQRADLFARRTAGKQLGK